MSLSLYLSFCKSSSQSLSSPDDKLSKNIWCVWSRTSYGVDKWRCHHADGRTIEQTSESATQSVDTGYCETEFHNIYIFYNDVKRHTI